MKKHILRKPDNWHAHLRQKYLLSLIVDYFKVYGRVLCMGNTDPLIETADQANAYKEEILTQGASFEPVMCIMLTEDTPKMIMDAAKQGIKLVKFIAIGTSTGATKGLRLDNYSKLKKVIREIIKADMFLLVHAELISFRDGYLIPFIKREEYAIDSIKYLIDNFPDLKITIEHASTAKMINFINYLPERINIGATLTPHHALLTYDAVFGDDVWPPINAYNYCLPVLKTESDRQAVIKAMTSGNPRFYGGTDSASHFIWQKEGDNPPAGISFGSTEIARYLEIFDRAGKFHLAEDFLSRFGAERYGFPLNEGTITVVEEEWIAPVEENGIRFCLGGEKLKYRILETAV